MPAMLDGVLESTTTTGTADLDLDGAQTGFESFSSAGAVSGRQYYYYIADSAAAPTLWERGVGTWTSGTPATLSRDRVIRSSSGTSKISLLSGTTYLVAAIDSVAAFQDADWTWLRSVSGTDTITAVGSPTLKAYAAGQCFRFVAAGANTGAVTLSIDGLGAKAVTKDGSTALLANEIASGAVVEVVYDGTRFQRIGGGASLSAANTFTADQTIQSTDGSAGAAPILNLDRNSASPAISDVLGDVRFSGRDSGGGTDVYASIHTKIVDPTATSEDGKVEIDTKVGGSLSTRVTIAQGVQVGSASGGDKGAGTLNATALYDDGVQITPEGNAKLWGHVSYSAGVPTLQSPSFNITSITDSGVGVLTVTIGTDFSDADCSVLATVVQNSSTRVAMITSQIAGSFQVRVSSDADAASDPDTGINFVAWGAQ